MRDAEESREAAAARLLRVLDERSARRRRGFEAPPIAPTVEQLVFDLALDREMKSGAR